MTDRVFPGAHLLVTGGAGFIGSELVRQVMARRDGTRITVLDKLTYAGNRANLAAVEEDPEQAARFAFVHGDIADPAVVDPLVAEADAVLNVAAETHVDRSILDPEAFLRTGVIGVHVLLEAIRAEAAKDRVVRFLQVSTDEVYGDIPDGHSVETDPLAPRSPYAAAKASSELLVRAYHITYGLDVVLTRGSNTYGPHQHPEKLIPLFTTNALAGEPLPMYGDGMQVRDWLHVSDHAAGIDFVLRHGGSGETYNVAGAKLLANREVIGLLLEAAGRDWSLVRTVPDRPGHDRRYAMDGSKLAALGWVPRVDFEDGLPGTVAWYRDHPEWVASARSGDWHSLLRAPVRSAARGRPRHRAAGPGGLSRVRVAVVGINGRLGRALAEALQDAPFTGTRGPIGWDQPELDLDTLSEASAGAFLDAERPEVVIHTAAWTDVDGCARDPELALLRNGTAAGDLARACARRGIDMVFISTNEVFDGRRTDGVGYAPGDARNPINPYGAAKVEGELQAIAAFGADDARGRLGIVRTSWLHGPPGGDFPAKIAAAALRARDSGTPLQVVADEIGVPTYAPDLAEAIVELVAEDAITAPPGRWAIHHLVNSGRASRADWAREVLRATGIDTPVVDVTGSTWKRLSTPPAWAVLAPTALPSGEPMRDWREAFADAVPSLVGSLRRS